VVAAVRAYERALRWVCMQLDGEERRREAGVEAAKAAAPWA